MYRTTKSNLIIVVKQLILTILFFPIVFNGCEENPEDFTLGKEYIESQTHLNLIDTFSVNLSTVILDTVETSGTGSMLIGNFNDNIFGKITSNTYFQVGIPENIYVEKDDIYDSLVLVIKYNKYSFGDTSKVQKISVHQLNEKIEINENNAITGGTTFNYNPDPAGTIIYTPKPNNLTDSLTIKINDGIGIDLFSKIKDNSEILTDNESFINYFKGLVLVSDNSYEGSIIGFKTSDTKLILYTSREADLSTEDIDYEFGLEDSTKQFNNIVHDFTSTQLNNLTKQRYKLPNSETNGAAFLQGGIGLAIRVDFPSLQELLLYNRGVVMKAQISISPLNGTYNEYNLPDNLYIYSADKLNRPITPLSSSTLNIDEIYHENTYYLFDITSYLNNALSVSYIDPADGLLITLPPNDLNTKFYRLIADENSKNTKLKIYYLSY